MKTRNEGLKSLCSAVEDVDGAKKLIGFCLGRQSWAFLSDSAVHTITSNRFHWLEIHSSAPNLHVILSKNKLQHKEKCKPVNSRKVLARQKMFVNMMVMLMLLLKGSMCDEAW